MLSSLPASFLWEDGVFETLRSEHRRVMDLDAHLDRLFESAHSIQLSLPSREEIKETLRREMKASPHPEAYVRLAFLRDRKRSRLFLIVQPAKRYPASLYEKGVTIRTSPTRRSAPSALDGQIKTKEFLNGLFATLDGLSSPGMFEEIYLDSDGYVTEGRTSNIFLKKGDACLTPPGFLGVLKGITRQQVIREAGRLGSPAREEIFTRFNLYSAEEVFLTNTSMGVLPVVSIDGRTIGDGRVGAFTKKMIQSIPRRKIHDA